MKMEKLFTRKFTFVINETLYLKLKNLAQLNGCSMGDVLRQCIEDASESHVSPNVYTQTNQGGNNEILIPE